MMILTKYPNSAKQSAEMKMRNKCQFGLVLGPVLWVMSLAAFGQVSAAMPADPTATSDYSVPSPYGLKRSTSLDPSMDSTRMAPGLPPTDSSSRDQSGTTRQNQFNPPRFPHAPADEQPSNFQRFVQQSTGRLLPIYGQKLFSTPMAYAPVSEAVVPNDYVIGPGDEIRLQVWGSIEAEYSLAVNRHGQINLPKVGVVNLAGVRAGDLESVLRSKIGHIFTNFKLNATLGRLRSIQIYVVGQARQPGTYTVSSLSTLINALFEVGGPSNNGSMRNIQLKRNGRSVGEMDLYSFIARGDRSGDVPLLPGDVIVIPPVGPRVAVLGQYEQPAIYELKGAGSIGDVLALGGGLSVLAKHGKVSLERIDPASDKAVRHVEAFALDTAGQRRSLRDGDILTLFEISPQFANAVTLRGNVATPLRYPFTPGMRIRDLIPDREALITPDYYKRKNLLVQFEDTDKTDADRAANKQVSDQDQTYQARDAGKQPNENGRSDTGQSQDKRRQSNQNDNVGANQTERKPANEHAETGVERGVRNLLDEVNWDYAVIERLNRDTLTTRLIPFNLGRVVQDGDDQQNLTLEPGDIVTILSKKDLRVPQDRQTRLVRVEGEVAAPGIYQIEAGETLPQLLTRLGGATSNAYLYGAEFTRESVRKQQQQNLDSVTRKLESQLQAASGKQLANNTAQGDTQSRFLAQQQLLQQQLDRLKTLRSNGRISLELPSSNVGLTALPALPLEDGDTIYVPSRPGFVSAIGEVFNENAIIYRPGKTVGDALKTAGLNDNAEIDSAFVLRADGSVSAARDSNSLFRMSSFEDIELMPGDTVVVPAKVDMQTNWTKFVTGLKDWTQILYQMGLGAAAWKTLK
jgi:protein involved in polysaccharide export with SLBB domain